MKKVVLILGIIMSMALFSSPGNAATFTTTNGTVTLTASTNSIHIVLTDTAVNPVSVSQNISGVVFSTDSGNAVLTTTVSPTSATYVTLDADGNIVGTAGAATWVYGGTSALYTLLWNGTGSTGPAYSIIGAPEPVSGDYIAANSSLTPPPTPDPHNPFINQTATFDLNIDGINSGTSITNIALLFGTNPTIPQVPEASGLFLFGTGLVGLVAWRRKKRFE